MLQESAQQGRITHRGAAEDGTGLYMSGIKKTRSFSILSSVSSSSVCIDIAEPCARALDVYNKHV